MECYYLMILTCLLFTHICSHDAESSSVASFLPTDAMNPVFDLNIFQNITDSQNEMNIVLKTNSLKSNDSGKLELTESEFLSTTSSFTSQSTKDQESTNKEWLIELVNSDSDQSKKISSLSKRSPNPSPPVNIKQAPLKSKISFSKHSDDYRPSGELLSLHEPLPYYAGVDKTSDFSFVNSEISNSDEFQESDSLTIIRSLDSEDQYVSKDYVKSSNPTYSFKVFRNNYEFIIVKPKITYGYGQEDPNPIYGYDHEERRNTYGYYQDAPKNTYGYFQEGPKNIYSYYQEEPKNTYGSYQEEPKHTYSYYQEEPIYNLGYDKVEPERKVKFTDLLRINDEIMAPESFEPSVIQKDSDKIINIRKGKTLEQTAEKLETQPQLADILAKSTKLETSLDGQVRVGKSLFVLPDSSNQQIKSGEKDEFKETNGTPLKPEISGNFSESKENLEKKQEKTPTESQTNETSEDLLVAIIKLRKTLERLEQQRESKELSIKTAEIIENPPTLDDAFDHLTMRVGGVIPLFEPASTSSPVKLGNSLVDKGMSNTMSERATNATESKETLMEQKLSLGHSKEQTGTKGTSDEPSFDVMNDELEAKPIPKKQQKFKLTDSNANDTFNDSEKLLLIKNLNLENVLLPKEVMIEQVKTGKQLLSGGFLETFSVESENGTEVFLSMLNRNGIDGTNTNLSESQNSSEQKTAASNNQRIEEPTDALGVPLAILEVNEEIINVSLSELVSVTEKKTTQKNNIKTPKVLEKPTKHDLRIPLPIRKIDGSEEIIIVNVGAPLPSGVADNTKIGESLFGVGIPLSIQNITNNDPSSFRNLRMKDATTALDTALDSQGLLQSDIVTATNDSIVSTNFLLSEDNQARKFAEVELGEFGDLGKVNKTSQQTSGLKISTKFSTSGSSSREDQFSKSTEIMVIADPPSGEKLLDLFFSTSSVDSAEDISSELLRTVHSRLEPISELSSLQNITKASTDTVTIKTDFPISLLLAVPKNRSTEIPKEPFRNLENSTEFSGISNRINSDSKVNILPKKNLIMSLVTFDSASKEDYSFPGNRTKDEFSETSKETKALQTYLQSLPPVPPILRKHFENLKKQIPLTDLISASSFEKLIPSEQSEMNFRVPSAPSDVVSTKFSLVDFDDSLEDDKEDSVIQIFRNISPNRAFRPKLEKEVPFSCPEESCELKEVEAEVSGETVLISEPSGVKTACAESTKYVTTYTTRFATSTIIEFTPRTISRPIEYSTTIYFKDTITKTIFKTIVPDPETFTITKTIDRISEIVEPRTIQVVVTENPVHILTNTHLRRYTKIYTDTVTTRLALTPFDFQPIYPTTVVRTHYRTSNILNLQTVTEYRTVSILNPSPLYYTETKEILQTNFIAITTTTTTTKMQPDYITVTVYTSPITITELVNSISIVTLTQYLSACNKQLSKSHNLGRPEFPVSFGQESNVGSRSPFPSVA